MYIIFAGKRTAGTFVEEVVKGMGGTIRFADEKPHIHEQMNDILALAHEGCDAIIYDSEQYTDEPEVISDTIGKIKNVNGARQIILTSTDNKNNVLIRACMDTGLRYFVNTAAKASVQKDQLSKTITGYYDANPKERPDLRRIERAREEERRPAGFTTVGVVGAMNRIGTTTQCIQIAKYLTFMGYKVCLIEMNSVRYDNRTLLERDKKRLSYIEKTRLIYRPEVDNPETGIFKLEGVDMLYDREKISELVKKKQGYDFLIYDYGVYSDAGFNKLAYLKDDRQFFVVGAGVTELDTTKDVVQNVSYKDAKLIFTFTGEKDKDGVLEVMERIKTAGTGNAARTYFAGYTPDPYILSDIKLYEAMLSVGKKAEENSNGRKKSILPWKR